MKHKYLRKRGLFSQKSKAIILSFFIAIIFMVALTLLPVWKLRQLVVKGTSHLAGRVLEEKVADFLGQNLWWLKRAEISKRILEIPAVQKAVLKNNFFSQMVVEVEERKPLLMTNLDNDLVILDTAGFIIARSSNYEEWVGNPFTYQNLAMVVGLGEGDFSSQKVEPVAFSSIKNILSNFKVLFPGSQLKIALQNKRKIMVTINDILPVILGEMVDLEEKVRVLKILLPVVGRDFSSIEYLDLSVPTCPVVRYLKK